MAKAAIVLLAGTGSPEAMGRMANALMTVKDFDDAGDEVRLILDGAGVQWPGELGNADHMYHQLYSDVMPYISGVCSYCAKAFKVKETIEQQGLPLAEQYKGHPSIRQLVHEGFQVITF